MQNTTFNYLFTACIQLLMLSLLPFTTLGNTDKPNHDLAQLVGAYHEVYDFSGTVMVVENEQVEFLTSYGLASRELNIPLTPQHRNSINSISKTFTAVSIMILVEQGKLDLHAPASAYLPEMKASWKNEVTIHQLLTHTSGLPREAGIEQHSEMSFKEQIDNLVVGLIPSKTEKKTYQYSNAGVILLGAIVEAVSKQSFNAFVEQQIIKPLKLKNTGLYKSKAIVPSQATPYRMTADGIAHAQRSKHFGDSAGGGMYSTVEDLYTFVLAIENNSLLSEKSKNLMLHPHVASGQSDSEGYLWSLKSFGGENLLFAAGSGYGTKSVFIRMPESKDFIAITSNWGNTPILPMLRDIYLLSRGKKVEAPTTDNLANAQRYSKHLGDYLFNAEQLQQQLGVNSGKLRLHAVNGKLFLDDELLTQQTVNNLGLTYTAEVTIQLPSTTQMLININGNKLLGTKI
ncbi:MAG: serine hydrolase [Alteromonadaceae bacterium]|nr:serine hydrolase [Alteromonadaceae bacterium]